MALPANESFDTGSNYKFSDKRLAPNMSRSVFDLSHLSTMTIQNAGLVFPIAFWDTLPSDDYDISVRSLLRVMPQVVPLYSRQRLYIYAFYSRYADLWSGFDAFIRKGYTGDYISAVPKLTSSNSVQSTVLHNSLGDYLQLPIGFSDFNGKVIALPPMMYARIWRDYFCNKNYYTDDRVIFPHDDSRFRLNDDGQLESAVDASKTVQFDLSSNSYGLPTYSGDVLKFGLFAHDYPQDYFTSSLPWPQRGTAPTISKAIDIDADISSTFTGTEGLTLSDYVLSNLFGSTTMGINEANDRMFYSVGLGSSYDDNWSAKSPFSLLRTYGTNAIYSSDFANGNVPGIDEGQITTANTTFNTWLKSQLATFASKATPKGTVSSTATFNTPQLNITLDDIRALAVSQLELERMARTDGSFAEFGLTFFGEVSRDAMDFRPTYIGGTYTGVSFTEVLQTSETTANSSLGQYGGHGILADNSGYIGHCHCDDYGFIMILGCMMPDVYYSQGVPKFWTRDLQADFFVPGREKLGVQPVLNKELYYQNGSDANDELFGYQDRFDEYRYIPNEIHGQIADSNSESFYPYTQARHFSTKPNLGKEFASATNVRKDYLAAPSEDAYSAQFSIDVRAVRPLPYRSVPANVIN